MNKINYDINFFVNLNDGNGVVGGTTCERIKFAISDLPDGYVIHINQMNRDASSFEELKDIIDEYNKQKYRIIDSLRKKKQ